MVMKKRPFGGKRGKVPPKKKVKRSKEFWKQRPTVDLNTVNESSSSDEETIENDDSRETDYEKLLAVFGDNKDAERVLSDSEDDDDNDNDDLEEEEEEEEDSDNDIEEEEEEDSDIENEEEEVEHVSDDEEGEEKDEIDEENEISSNEEDLTVPDDDEEEEEEKTIMGDGTGGPSDPFMAHFELKIKDEMITTLESGQYKKPEVLHFETIGKVEQRLLDYQDRISSSNDKKRLLLDDEVCGEDDNDQNQGPDEEGGGIRVQTRKNQIKFCQNPKPSPFTTFEKMNVKLKLLRDRDLTFDRFQQDFFSILNSYRDFYFSERSSSNGERIRSVYALHILNHVLKTRTKIMNNNAKAATRQSASQNMRDQGLVRPKVLVVLPFRESCRRLVEFMIGYMFHDPNDASKHVANKKRFDEDFGSDVRDVSNKPDDFNETFAGNIDDSFKIGISLGKKAMKLYSDFYSSDIIISSPLGLRLVIGAEGDKERDFDFLSSIEMLIMDQIDIFSMQNWDHVTHFMNHLHKKPVKSHGVDFSRVRLWTLDDLSRYYRQTILISEIKSAEINSLYNKRCLNYFGKMRTMNPTTSGSVCHVVVNVPMTFRRFESNSIVTSPESRFKFFVNKVLPDFTKDSMFHTLIFVPSYFDFVTLRNHFAKTGYDYGEICEYTEDKKIAAARDNFFHNELHFILYTERSHFYRRFRIKGIRHLVFYQLSQYPRFFSELVNFMVFQNRKGGGSDANMSVTILYDKYDVHKLSAVTGTDRCSRMLDSEKGTHMFMANEK